MITRRFRISLAPKILCIILIIFSFLDISIQDSFSQDFFSTSLKNVEALEDIKEKDLRVGDILLQPLDCWTCTLIEQQERTDYSHIGIVVQVYPEVLVAEAFIKVRFVSLKTFHEKTEKGMGLLVKRLNSPSFDDNSQDFFDYVKENFLGLKYDSHFLWNNVDDEGREKIYCSELVSKSLEGFLGIKTPRKIMTFDVNPKKWEKFFRAKDARVPKGEWGNSPGDFERSSLFHHLGFYY